MGVKAAQPSARRAALENSARGTSHVESCAVSRASSRFHNTHEKRYEEFLPSPAGQEVTRFKTVSFSFFPFFYCDVVVVVTFLERNRSRSFECN